MRNTIFCARGRAGFTLFEVIIALMILGLLSGAVYSISFASLEASKSVMREQSAARRLEAFLRITREAFLNLPADGSIFLRISQSSGGSPVPELVFKETSGAFGVASLGGGSLFLAARPRADGSRAFSILRVPMDIDASETERLVTKGAWVSLLPGASKVKWLFFNGNEWVEEWPEGGGRPQLVRLQFSYDPMAETPMDIQFWIPPLAPPQAPSADAAFTNWLFSSIPPLAPPQAPPEENKPQGNPPNPP